MKINWSGRAHNYSSADINYLLKIIKKADPMTQGYYLKKFQKDFSDYIGKKNVFAVSSAAAALEIIAALLKIKKNEEVILPRILIVHQRSRLQEMELNWFGQI